MNVDPSQITSSCPAESIACCPIVMVTKSELEGQIPFVIVHLKE